MQTKPPPEKPWKQVKRRGRILVGQPPASRRHPDRRKKPPKHKKTQKDLLEEA